MELGQYQIQVFVSLVVILCAACITVICEFVKNRRQSAEQTNQPTTVTRASADTQSKSPAKGKRVKEKRPLTAEAAKAVERGTQLAQIDAAIPVIPFPSLSYESLRRPAKVLPEPEVVSAQPEPVAQALEIPVPEPATPEQVNAEEVVIDALVLAAAVEPQIEQPASVAIVAGIVEEKVASAPPKRNWGSVLQSGKVNQGNRPAPTARLMIPIKPSTLPSGIQDGYLLTKLVQNRQPVSGLVVSVGLRPHDESGIPESMDAVIQSLLGPADFAARASRDQYLLIFPGERGEAAERRLADITEQLANANHSVLFSCGGVEVRSEAIQHAIDSASQRMREIRSNRSVPVDDNLSQAV
jgi:hypothetical protein